MSKEGNLVENKPKVTGVMIQYYYISKKELWYFANNINMNYEDDNIEIGNQVQDESYKRKSKHILIDNTIAIDVIEDENTILEIKKSSLMEKPAKMQLKYYLWYMKNKKGKEMKGVLVYPKERKRETVDLTIEDEEEIEEVVEEIRKIITRPEPPDEDIENLPKNATYYDFLKV